MTSESSNSVDNLKVDATPIPQYYKTPLIRLIKKLLFWRIERRLQKVQQNCETNMKFNKE